MTRADWIGVVSVVIGIPGLLVVFFTPYWAVGVLIVALLLVIGGASVIVKRAVTRPQFMMDNVSVQLVVHDVNGIKATLSKCYTAVPQYGHIDAMTHRNIGADGAITGFKWNDHPVDPSWVQTSAGQYSVNVRFPGPLQQHGRYNWTLSYEADNSFLGHQESLYYVVDFPAKEVTISVTLPVSRAPRSAHCYLVEGAAKKALKDPAIHHQSGTISVRIKKPRVGSEYEIAWQW